ncbi:unnamed protein product [marine sediment metagenome]|uniref:Uncharacterized protein n=1 Tax=marine sediment metagenome TaxID=412755 RepID=X0UNP0_9ZZZZ
MNNNIKKLYTATEWVTKCNLNGLCNTCIERLLCGEIFPLYFCPAKSELILINKYIVKYRYKVKYKKEK